MIHRILIFCLCFVPVFFGCTRDPHPEIVRSFHHFLVQLHEGDPGAIDSLLHPDSPFFQGRPDKDRRTNFWRGQRFKLLLAEGTIDILDSKEVDGRRVCRYRLTPDSPLYAPAESTVSFALDQGKWKPWIPRQGFEINPIDFSDVRIVQSGTVELDNGNRVTVEMVQESDRSTESDRPDP